MKKVYVVFSILFLCSISFFNCGGDRERDAEEEMTEEQKTEESIPESQNGEKDGEAETQTESSIENRKPAKPVSFRKLIEYLPKSFSELSAEKPVGESMNMGEWQFSNAQINFNSEDGSKWASVEIFDYAYINELYLPYQTFFNMNYERESSEGYERSMKIDGNPSFERWNEEGMGNEVTVLVGKRFIVHTQTNGMPEGSAKDLIEDMDLPGLANEKSN